MDAVLSEYPRFAFCFLSFLMGKLISLMKLMSCVRERGDDEWL